MVLTLETTLLMLTGIYYIGKECSTLPSNRRHKIPRRELNFWPIFWILLLMFFILFLLFCFWFLCELYHLKWLRTILLNSLIYFFPQEKKWAHFPVKSLKDCHCLMSSMTTIFNIDFLDTWSWSLGILGGGGVNLLQGEQAIMA